AGQVHALDDRAHAPHIGRAVVDDDLVGAWHGLHHAILRTELVQHRRHLLRVHIVHRYHHVHHFVGPLLAGHLAARQCARIGILHDLHRVGTGRHGGQAVHGEDRQEGVVVLARRHRPPVGEGDLAAAGGLVKDEGDAGGLGDRCGHHPDVRVLEVGGQHRCGTWRCLRARDTRAQQRHAHVQELPFHSYLAVSASGPGATAAGISGATGAVASCSASAAISARLSTSSCETPLRSTVTRASPAPESESNTSRLRASSFSSTPLIAVTRSLLRSPRRANAAALGPALTRRPRRRPSANTGVRCITCAMTPGLLRMACSTLCTATEGPAVTGGGGWLKVTVASSGSGSDSMVPPRSSRTRSTCTACSFAPPGSRSPTFFSSMELAAAPIMARPSFSSGADTTPASTSCMEVTGASEPTAAGLCPNRLARRMEGTSTTLRTCTGGLAACNSLDGGPARAASSSAARTPISTIRMAATAWGRRARSWLPSSPSNRSV